MTSRFATAKARALDALDELVPELFGSGAKQTHRYRDRWAVANKWRGGDLSQMTVWRQGGRRGAWKDFVNGDKGDVIMLVAYGLTGATGKDEQMRAVEFLEDRFGIRNMSPEARAAIEAQAQLKREAFMLADRQRLASDKRRTQKFFFSTEPEIAGTPVETYLATRSIRLGDVPQLSTALRYCPEAQYWPGQKRDGEGNRIGDVPTFPAMIAAMATAQGGLRACHYTFLEPDGSKKLDTLGRGYVDANGEGLSAKLMFPATTGLMIHVTNGPSGLRTHEAGAAGVTDWWGITEGIEDALSAAIGDPRLRMFAAGSLSGLRNVPDHPSARGFLVFKDNDWGKPQAQALFDRAIARLRSFDKPVTEASVPADWGKDVNDALRGEN